MFLGRISSKTCLKIDCFGSKSLKKSPSAGAPPPGPLTSGGWGLRPQTPVQVK